MSVIVDQLQLGDISRPAQYMDMFQRKPGIRILRLDARTKPHRANLRDDYKLVQEATLNEKKQKKIQIHTTRHESCLLHSIREVSS